MPGTDIPRLFQGAFRKQLNKFVVVSCHFCLTEGHYISEWPMPGTDIPRLFQGAFRKQLNKFVVVSCHFCLTEGHYISEWPMPGTDIPRLFQGAFRKQLNKFVVVSCHFCLTEGHYISASSSVIIVLYISTSLISVIVVTLFPASLLLAPQWYIFIVF